MQCGNCKSELKFYKLIEVLSLIPAVGHVMNAEFAETFTANVSFKRFYKITNIGKQFLKCGKKELMLWTIDVKYRGKSPQPS